MPSSESVDANSLDRARLARILAEAGIQDVLVVSRDTAATVLTDTRQELISCMRDGDAESVSEIAATLDRDKATVEQDLDALFEADIIEYDTTGETKSPRLKHQLVIAEPIA